MSIRVHIERLVLEGLPIGRHEGPLVQAAVEAELARLIAAQAPTHAGGAVARVAGEGIRVANGASPARVGRDIARAVHGGIK